MKKISLLMIAALMSMSMLSCDIESARPFAGTVYVQLEGIPEGINAVSIWCALNEWKAENVNGSKVYIVDVKDDKTLGKRVAKFELADYVLSEPLEFQFTPMENRDVKMGDDWWSYAISGSSNYGNNENNIVCDFVAKKGQPGCIVHVNSETYPDWQDTFPCYGINSSRWFTEKYKACFSVK